MKQSTTGKTKNKKSAPASKAQHKTGGRGSSSNSGSRGNSGSRADGSSDDIGFSMRSGSSGSNSGSIRGNTGSTARSSSERASRNDSGSKARSSSSARSSSGSSLRNSSSTSGSGNSREKSFQGESHLEKFFLDQLKDIYYAENKITQSLPKMQEAATTEELKEAFEDHLHQTQRHVKRLEKVFASIGKSAEGKKCEAIEGIVREAEEIIEETEEGTLTRDAALIIAAQKVEHYEIASYGGLLQLAITMQLHEAADLLDKTLIEEEDTDARLTEIAESDINLQAEHEDAQSSWDEEQTEDQQEEDDEEDVDEESPTVQ